MHLKHLPRKVFFRYPTLENLFHIIIIITSIMFSLFYQQKKSQIFSKSIANAQRVYSQAIIDNEPSLDILSIALNLQIASILKVYNPLSV